MSRLSVPCENAILEKKNSIEDLTASKVFVVLAVVIISEPVFLNVYGAQELTPRNEFRQPVTWRAGTITLFLIGS
jgi:hypothetical protein